MASLITKHTVLQALLLLILCVGNAYATPVSKSIILDGTVINLIVSSKLTTSESNSPLTSPPTLSTPLVSSQIKVPLRSKANILKAIMSGIVLGGFLMGLVIAIGVYLFSKRHRQILLLAYISLSATAYIMLYTPLVNYQYVVSLIYLPVQLLAFFSAQLYILMSVKSIELKRGFLKTYSTLIVSICVSLIVSAFIPLAFKGEAFSIAIVITIIASAVLLYRSTSFVSNAYNTYLFAWVLISLQGVYHTLLATGVVSGHLVNELLSVLNVIVLTSTMLIADRQKVRQYHHNLTHDDDTDLPNKQLLLKCSEQLMRTKQAHSLVLFRPNVLLTARTNFGYDYASTCILLIMAKLAEQLAPMDVLALEQSKEKQRYIARLDESCFAFIVPAPLELSHIEQFTCIIDAVFAQGITHNTTQFVDHLEIGVAHSPLHAKTPTQLVQCALQALNVKSANGQRWQMFNSESADKVKQHMKIAAELRSAIEKDQLSLYFQPQVYLADAKVYGAEALLRWHHPELGHVPPDVFIPIAESSGMISELTEWVVTHAVTFQAELVKFCPEHVLSINISAKDLSRKELPVLFITLLNEYQLPANSIMLELTESATLDEGKNIKSALQDYRLIGVKIAIDDFGTGYSSLATLSQMGFDEIKIDKQFVMNLEFSKNDQTICQATCDIAKSLGSHVVAEGIESEQALQTLLSYGCEIGQGYYFSRPLAFNEYMQWLDDYLNSTPKAPTLDAVSNLNGKNNH